jgi:hypothetical protein
MTPSMGISIPVVGKSSDGLRYIYGASAQKEFIAAVNFSY